ncbi:hypothetical protein C5S53_09725 [Methanophagales archaeon]|nr:hypothetical protein C5S53_09725 [Methanophagales archaeon]
MKSSRKQNIFVFAIFLFVIVLLYSIVGGGNAQYDVYTSKNLSNHSVTMECPDKKNCSCTVDDVEITSFESYANVTSNVQRKENTYANAIGYKLIETFPDDTPITSGIYKYEGKVRLPVLPDVNQTEKPHAVQMSIQFQDGGETLEGRIYWDLDPWTQDGKRGKIKVHTNGVDLPILTDTGIRSYQNKPFDTDWHTFELVVDFATQKYVTATFDDETKNLCDYELVQVESSSNDTNTFLNITTESLAARPSSNENFTWTTQFKDLNLSRITTLPVTAKITEPEDGVTVFDDPVSVYGMVKNFANDELSLWACVKSYDGIWYPQETLTMTGEETWEADTRPGIPTNPADIGKKFRIVVLVATREADKELRKPLRGEGDVADGWGLKALPKGAKTLDQITVIRGKS